MAVTLYRSTDGSAPTLSGTAGDLITVLDACLVNGYGSKAAAGWTKSFSGTNTATYRQGSGSNQYYLNVNDNGPGAGTGKEARIFGSETASAVLTGTNLFPTAAQFTNGLFVRKSNTADATVRPWVVLADARTMYMFILTNDTANAYYPWMFGEIYSLKSSDLGRCAITGRNTENSGSVAFEFFDILCSLGTNRTGHYLARDTQNNVGAILFGQAGDITLGHANGGTNVGTLTYTNPADSRIYTTPARVIQTTGGNHVRGRMRGYWLMCHAITNFSDGDTYAGAGDLAGKTFLILKGTGNSGLYILETSNTWESN